MPAEYFIPPAEAETSYQNFGRTDFLSYALRRRITSNGVFGSKMFWSHLETFADWVRRTRPQLVGHTTVELLQAVFPNLHYVHVHRRDHVRQAISYIKAKENNVWQWFRGQPRPPFEREFDIRAIDREIAFLRRQDEAWREFFAAAGIEPTTVVYEELVERPRDVLHEVLGGLGLEPPADLTVPKVDILRQADDLTEQWVERYHSEHASEPDGRR